MTQNRIAASGAASAERLLECSATESFPKLTLKRHCLMTSRSIPDDFRVRRELHLAECAGNMFQWTVNMLTTSTETRTRFGSLEFGVVVPDRADARPRMVYAGPNKLITSVDAPYRMLTRHYGNRDGAHLFRAGVSGLLASCFHEWIAGSTVVSMRVDSRTGD